MTSKTEQLIYEAKTALDWEVYGSPVQDLRAALDRLERLRELESKRPCPKTLRLVRVTREILSEVKIP